MTGAFTGWVYDPEFGCMVEFTDDETGERFYGYDPPRPESDTAREQQ